MKKILRITLLLMISVNFINCDKNSDENTNSDDEQMVDNPFTGSPSFHIAVVDIVDLDIIVTDPNGNVVEHQGENNPEDVEATTSFCLDDYSGIDEGVDIACENIVWFNNGPLGEYTFYINNSFNNDSVDFSVKVFDENVEIENFTSSTSGTGENNSPTFTYVKQ